MATATNTSRAANTGGASSVGRTTRTEKGISLARGPALILGTILLAAGLYFLYKAHSFPRWSNFPNGHAPKDGKFFLGIFGANGWTGELTAVAGGLLLFGAAQHLLAKTMSLIVGIALGAAAIIALISGNVLGMAAANIWTEIGWGACAVILLFNTLIPRRRREVVVAEDAAAVGTGGAVAEHEHRRRERHEVEGAAAVGAGAAVAEHEHRPRERHEVEGAGASGNGGAREGEPLVAREGAAAPTSNMTGSDTATGATASNGSRNGVFDDKTDTMVERPRRFEAGSGSDVGDDGGQGSGTTRRSGGLAGLFRRS
jgi:hypothetical protein